MQSDSRSRSRRRAAAAVAVLFLFGSIAGYAASRPRAEHRAAAPVAAERARPAPTATAPPPTPAPARAAPRPHGPRAQWLHLARALAAPWPRLQRRAGNFPDFTDGLIPGQSGADTRYGDAVLGWALMEQGRRTRGRRLVTAGAKAVTWATRGAYRHDLQSREPSVFEIMAVAGAYNLARTRV